MFEYPKIGVVLSSEGVRGVYAHTGFLLALEKWLYPLPLWLVVVPVLWWVVLLPVERHYKSGRML